MKINVLIYSGLFGALLLFSAGNMAKAATYAAATCSLDDVKAACALAAHGDTVTVPAGECNWTSQLLITKNISIQGTGDPSPTAGTRIINRLASNGNSQKSMVYFNLTDTDNTNKVKLSNIYFNARDTVANGQNMILLINNQNRTVEKELVVNNIYFDNAGGGDNELGVQGGNFVIVGYVKGVINNCTFLPYTNVSASIIAYRSIGAITDSAWNNAIYTDWKPGSSQSIFVEDNLFKCNGYGGPAVLAGRDSHIVMRYNTFDYSACNGYTYFADSHGRQVGWTMPSFGLEAYGNKFMLRTGCTADGGSDPCQNYNMANLRGSLNYVFNNKSEATKSGGIFVTGAYADTYHYSVVSQLNLPACAATNQYGKANLYAGYKTCSSAASTGRPFHPYGWIWNNVYSGSNTPASVLIDLGSSERDPSNHASPTCAYTDPPTCATCQAFPCPKHEYDYNNLSGNDNIEIVKDTHLFLDYRNETYTSVANQTRGYLSKLYTYKAGETFNGTKGTGFSTLANRPATCTPGVGYWATNFSNPFIAGTYGQNPSNPTAHMGTLYTCFAGNNWVASYTPYQYPHPLRNETPSAPPSAPSGLSVQ